MVVTVFLYGCIDGGLRCFIDGGLRRVFRGAYKRRPHGCIIDGGSGFFRDTAGIQGKCLLVCMADKKKKRL